MIAMFFIFIVCKCLLELSRYDEESNGSYRITTSGMLLHWPTKQNQRGHFPD